MLGRLLQTLEPSLLDLANLFHDELPAFYVAVQFGKRIGRNGFAFGCAHVFQALRRLLQLGVEVANAKPRQSGLHAVDDASSLADQGLMLPVRSFGIFFRQSWNRDHLAVIALAAQPTKKGAFQELSIEPVRLGTAVLARYRDARGVDDVGLDTMGAQPASQPETVPADLEGNGDALDLVAGLLRFLPPSIEQL